MKFIIKWELIQIGTSEIEAESKEKAIKLSEENFDAGNFVIDPDCEGWKMIEIHETDKFFGERFKEQKKKVI